MVVSLLGLLLIGLSFTTGLGIGAALIASFVVTSSLTLLPAVLDMVKVARATAANIDFTASWAAEPCCASVWFCY